MNKVIFLALSLLTLPLPAFAQTEKIENVTAEATSEQLVGNRVSNSTDKNYLTISYENDLIGGGTDKYYTSGVRATWFNAGTPVPDFIDEAADAIPTFDLNDTTSTFFTVGQNIFTPDDITLRANQDDSRPWAAFLYGSVGLLTIEDNHTDEVEFTLGVVGPQALGEQTQKLIHSHLTGSPTPKGWSNQLEFEPGIIISAGRRWPKFAKAHFLGLELAAAPNVNVSLGNIYTYAGAGVGVTLSPYYDRFQDTPPRVRPAMPGSGYFDSPNKGKIGWLIFAAADGRLVARDIFLDGNTFEDSASVDKKYLVGDATAGLALTFSDYRLSYSLNARSKEFNGQEEESVFGAVTLSTKF